MELRELQEKRRSLLDNSNITLNNMRRIINESERVSDIACNSRQILDDLDFEFESLTGLSGNDITFLFVAVGLQLIRILIINEITKIENAGSSNRNETKLHELQKRILEKLNSGEIVKEKPYYASMEHIVTKMGVPYDATSVLSEKVLANMIKKDRIWDFDITGMIPTEKLSLFKGANHRFATLGHDPILGLVFGTSNIMTNTITCVKTPLIAGGVGIPVLTTNHVVVTSDFKDPRIAAYASTVIMIRRVIERTKEEPSAFVASLIKQIIHIGTDLYTPCGIQIPGANLILSNSEVEKITSYISAGDILKVGTSSKVAELINLLIATLHMLMYDSTMPFSRDLYNVRTRKIIMYSNAIATGSNVLWVGGNMLAGNEGAIRQLDVGGLMVTLKRLHSDKEFIRQIKEEFVIGGFNKMIQGDAIS